MSGDVTGRTARPPRIFDRVPAPDGYECQRYRNDGGDLVPCDREADYVFVYEGSIDPDDDTRRNCLACSECTPEVDSRFEAPHIHPDTEIRQLETGEYRLTVVRKDGETMKVNLNDIQLKLLKRTVEDVAEKTGVE